MKNNQFYKLTLTDCAIPSCCSGGKDYYGTIEEVEDLTPPTKKDKREFKESKPEKESLNVAPFKEEEFWYASDSGLKLASFLHEGKLYKFPANTVKHLNQLVEAINTIVHH